MEVACKRTRSVRKMSVTSAAIAFGVVLWPLSAPGWAVLRALPRPVSVMPKANVSSLVVFKPLPFTLAVARQPLQAYLSSF